MPDRPECTTCATPVPHLAYKCNYCGYVHCGTHRLPEKHDCPGLKALKLSNDEWQRSVFENVGHLERPFGMDEVNELFEKRRESGMDPASEKRGASDDNKSNSRSTTSLSSGVSRTERERDLNKVVDILNSNPPDVKDYERDQSVSYETVEPLVYSSTPEPEYESSPDLAPDGSLITEDDSSDESDPIRSFGSSPRKTIYGGIILVVLLLFAVLLYQML